MNLCVSGARCKGKSLLSEVLWHAVKSVSYKVVYSFSPGSLKNML